MTFVSVGGFGRSYWVECEQTHNKGAFGLKVYGCPSGAASTAQVQDFVRQYQPEASIAMAGNGRDNKNVNEPFEVMVTLPEAKDNKGIRDNIARLVAGALVRPCLGEKIQVRGALIQVGEHIVDRSEWNWGETRRNPLFSPNAKAAVFWGHFLEELAKAERSVGSVVEIQVSGLPAGWTGERGEGLDSRIAGALMGLSGVKGVEIGSGFAVAALTCHKDGDSTINHDGGISRGATTGRDLVVRLAIKPTALHEGEGVKAPCLGVSLVPVVESLVAALLFEAKMNCDQSSARAVA